MSRGDARTAPHILSRSQRPVPQWCTSPHRHPVLARSLPELVSKSSKHSTRLTHVFADVCTYRHDERAERVNDIRSFTLLMLHVFKKKIKSVYTNYYAHYILYSYYTKPKELFNVTTTFHPFTVNLHRHEFER